MGSRQKQYPKGALVRPTNDEHMRLTVLAKRANLSFSRFWSSRDSRDKRQRTRTEYKLAHLIRADAPEPEIKSAARMAHDFAAAFNKTLATRQEMGRERPPQVVYTTEEWKQLKEYRASTDVPVKENRATARLQANCVLAGAEMKDAEARAEAFQVSRHLWKLDVEGWEKGLSLKDVEQAIKSKTEEKLKLYNFLRPGKREEIQGQIDYLREVKKDVQKQLATKELSIARGRGAAEVRFQVAAKQVEETRDARVVNGKGMPSPIALPIEGLVNCDSARSRQGIS